MPDIPTAPIPGDWSLPDDAIASGVMEVGGPYSGPQEVMTLNLPSDWERYAPTAVMWMSINGELVRVPHAVTEADGGLTTYEGRMEARDGKLTVTVDIHHSGPGEAPTRVVEWYIFER